MEDSHKTALAYNDSDTNLTRASIRGCAAAALLAGLVYLNALDNPFVYDDYRTIVDNGSIRTLTDPRSIIFHDVTRPLVNFSYALDRAVCPTRPGAMFVSIERNIPVLPCGYSRLAKAAPRR